MKVLLIDDHPLVLNTLHDIIHTLDPNVQVLTADGPVLSFHGADVELTATRAVRVDCERFEVRARDGIAMQTDGDLSHDALGAVELAGDRARIVAREGALTLDARDDVQVDGARVLLNCADDGERERP